MAKFVQIHSNITVQVTTGLQNTDVTNVDAHVPDRLKVNPQWPKHLILIHKGAGKYPAEIAEWASVKALAKDKILTIGLILELKEDELNVEEKKQVNTAAEAKDEFKLGLALNDEKKGKTLTLNDLAGGK